MKRLHVILKVAERCNIACSYCYYYFAGDDSHAKQPAIMTADTIDDLIHFCRDAVRDFDLEAVRLYFHGGEPLMMGKQRFDEMCVRLTEGLCAVTYLKLALQTNGMLIDDDWIALFSRHQVGIGVSLDGPRAQNDKYRVDRKGRSTFARTMAGIELLQSAVEDGRLRRFGVLTVANFQTDPIATYEFFVHEAGIRNLDFLWPDDHHDSVPPVDNSQATAFFTSLFDRWAKDDDRSIRIQVFKSLMARFIGDEGYAIEDQFASGKSRPRHPIDQDEVMVTVRSSGELQLEDVLFQLLSPNQASGYTIKGDTLRAFLDSPFYRRAFEQRIAVPECCRQCYWLNVCGSGQAQNRFSRRSGLACETVYCAALKKLYAHVARYMLLNGVDAERIERVLTRDQDAAA